jgi:hypothetical protein
MSRFVLSEIATTVIRGRFVTGDTISVTIYNNASGTPVPLDSNSCIEIGTTGFFVFGLNNITTPPTSYADLLFIMSDGDTAEVSGNIIFGGFLETIDANVGANEVTITIEESDETPIVSAEVQLLNSDQTVVLDTKITDSNGEVVFSADDGSYKVRSTKAQVSFTLPETLTVSGTTTDTYNGIVNVISPESGAGECEVSIFSASQKPSAYLSTLKGTAIIKSLPTLLTGIYYSGQKVLGAYSASTGRLYWILPRGAVVAFVVDDLGINTEKTIPDSASSDYQDL